MFKELLEAIPKMDILIMNDKLNNNVKKYGKQLVLESARDITEIYRKGVINEKISYKWSIDDFITRIIIQCEEKRKIHLRPVINATGVILHTNLGRAVLSEEAAKAAYEAGRNYNTLEYDLETGKRGSRYSHVEGILSNLCGSESAMVVNNNAAAVLLILNTIAKDQKVIISRGELVEIGGSFRIPEIIEMSNAKLIDIGTTNKTHDYDYEKAITEDTAALMKVHTSNYKIVGFTEEVKLKDMVDIGIKHNLPVIYDLGSGAFFNTENYGIAKEPDVKSALKDGADLVSFSGDKLLGGPQAGLILGKAYLIDKLKRNPLTRALRVDKMTLAALEATLKQYKDFDMAQKKIPTLTMLAQSLDDIKIKAEKLKELLDTIDHLNVEYIEEKSAVGGGSLPGELLDTICITVSTDLMEIDIFEEKLRKSKKPIISRISKNKILFDVRTIKEEDFECIKYEITDIVS